MKQPKIKWPTRKAKRQEVIEVSGYSRTQIDARIVDAVSAAEKMTHKGCNRIDAILDADKKRWVSRWNKDAMLVLWFGKVTTKGQVKDVSRRMAKLYDRTANKTLTIKVKPAKDSTNAMNGGGFISPKTFQVFPNWIIKGKCSRGSIVAHELMHEWFLDQKIDGETVYGGTLAKKLAKREPRKARKSAENYEQFCRDLHC